MAVRVICFDQEGCMGCEEQASINREVSKNLNITLEVIDVVKNPHHVHDYGLRVTPTILILQDDGVVERFEGVVHREELEAAIKEYL